MYWRTNGPCARQYTARALVRAAAERVQAEGAKAWVAVVMAVVVGAMGLVVEVILPSLVCQEMLSIEKTIEVCRIFLAVAGEQGVGVLLPPRLEVVNTILPRFPVLVASLSHQNHINCAWCRRGACRLNFGVFFDVL